MRNLLQAELSFEYNPFASICPFMVLLDGTDESESAFPAKNKSAAEQEEHPDEIHAFNREHTEFGSLAA